MHTKTILASFAVRLGAATFDQVGTFAYRCEIHPTMQGSVRVVPST